jgi:hypothetical protein
MAYGGEAAEVLVDKAREIILQTPKTAKTTAARLHLVVANAFRSSAEHRRRLAESRLRKEAALGDERAVKTAREVLAKRIAEAQHAQVVKRQKSLKS